MARNRLSGAAAGGLEASLIGLTMAGCIGVGYLIGNWLDGKLGTTYLMPIFVVLGIIAGAREMWMTVSRIRRSFSDGTFDNPEISEAKPPQESRTSKPNRAVIAEPSHRKPRFFHVPPPPAPQSDSKIPSASDDLDEHEGQKEITLEKQLSQLRQLQQEIDNLEPGHKPQDSADKSDNESK